MATHRIPVEAFVWTTKGPCRADNLEPVDEVTIINSNGKVGRSAIRSVSLSLDHPVVRLRTTAGEIHLDERAVITTRGARVFAASAAIASAAGRRLRVELAHPRDLPVQPRGDDLGEVTRAALSLLKTPVVRVPRRLGMHDYLADMLRAAGVDYVDASDDRWTAFCFKPETMSTPTAIVGAGDAAVLQAITAWARTDTHDTESRTTLEQGVLRQRLVAALAASGRRASVTWTPGYGPVEARVTAGAGGSFATTRGAEQSVSACVDVAVTDPGSLITDLAIVGPRRGPNEG